MFPMPKKSCQMANHLAEANCDIEYLRKPISPVPEPKFNENQSQITSNKITSVAMRKNVIRELIETEENYVKLLASLCVG